MARLWMSATILLLGLFWLSVGAPSFGVPLPQSGELDPNNPDCAGDDPECIERLNAAVLEGSERPPTPGPEADERVRSAVLANDAVRSLTAGLTLGTDFWLPISHSTDTTYGETWANAELVLREPASFHGSVPRTSDPCENVRGEDGEFLTAAPGETPSAPKCLGEARVRGTVEIDVKDARYFVVEVANGNEVTNITPIELRDDTLAEMIKAIIAAKARGEGETQ